MSSRLPLPVERVVQKFAAFAVVFPAEQLLTVCPDDEAAPVVVELIVCISLIGRQVQNKLIAAWMFDLQGVSDRGRLVVGQRAEVTGLADRGGGAPSVKKLAPETSVSATTLDAVGTACAITAWAAFKYFSISMGDIVRTSLMLSKPCPASSGGNCVCVS